MPVWKFCAVAFAAFAIPLFLVALTPQETTAERIARICRQDYGSRGNAAVKDCELDMTARVVLERRRDQREATYGRINP